MRYKTSNYGKQLREKQKVRRIYGISKVNSEIISPMPKEKSAVTGNNSKKKRISREANSPDCTTEGLRICLSTRLTSSVKPTSEVAVLTDSSAAINFADSMAKFVDIPSFQIKPHDIIKVP